MSNIQTISKLELKYLQWFFVFFDIKTSFKNVQEVRPPGRGKKLKNLSVDFFLFAHFIIVKC